MRPRLARGTPPLLGALWLLPLVLRRPGLRVAALALAGTATWFFRDPDRTPEGDGLLAAADGVVQGVTTDGEGRTTVSTYLNLFDVHVTRAPCDGVVVRQSYRAGRHRRASTPGADANERLEWHLATDHGEVLLTQYAGTVARRIVAYRSPGDRVRRGERIGLIRFGSRVDVRLPEGVCVAVQPRARLAGGSSVLGRVGLT